MNVGVPADVLKARWMGLCKVSEKEEKPTMYEECVTQEKLTMQEEQAT